MPRIEQIHEPLSCTCGQCGLNLVKIGEDISEQLDVVPAQFTVHRHIRPQYACRSCEIITADPIPPAIIDGGLGTPGLLAWVMISKYSDHLPLYRLEQIAARSGVPLARSTLGSWVGRVEFSLQPIYECLKDQLLSGRVIHADETPSRQLDPGKGKTHSLTSEPIAATLWMRVLPSSCSIIKPAEAVSLHKTFSQNGVVI